MPPLTWTVELHAHTIYSKDCLLKPERIPELCREKGLDRVAITDHDEVAAGLELARLHPMLVIPGLEIMTTRGELLAWYVRGPVAPGLPPAETISRLRDQGAVIGVAHPFDRYRRGAWKEADLIPILRQLDCIEVFNARCISNEDNERAYRFALDQGIPIMTGGSDAHTAREYGHAPMRMPAFANNANGFRQALAESERVENLSSKMVHVATTWAKWVRRLGIVRP